MSGLFSQLPRAQAVYTFPARTSIEISIIFFHGYIQWFFPCSFLFLGTIQSINERLVPIGDSVKRFLRGILDFRKIFEIL
jgi:hypothetical protein